MKKISKLALLLAMCHGSIAQHRIPVSALEYLYINPDAQQGALGALGLPSAHSSSLNVASTAFENSKNALGFSYTPWNRSLVKDMNMFHISGFGQTDDKGRWNVSITHFSYGKVELRDEWGQEQGTISPFDLNIRMAHARKLNPELSVGTGIRLLWSNPLGAMAWQGGNLRPIVGINADLGVFWHQNREKEQDFWMDAGVSIHNIGGRISYGDNKKRNFQPTLFRINAATTYRLNHDKNSFVTLSLDALKQLVPTPPLYANDGKILRGKEVAQQTGISTIFTSWADAPDGLSEEFKEIWWATAIQYQHRQVFTLRANYFSDHRQKGNRHLLTMGVGILNLKRENAQWGIEADFNYTLSLKGYNPLGNSFQLGLTFKRPQ